jgi:uracil-DNA glycosylase
MSTTLTASEAAAILAFYAQAGVDMAIDEVEHDRLAEGAARVESALRANAPPSGGRELPGISRESAARPGPPPPASSAALAPDTAALNARRMAAGAATLDELRAALESFEGCPLRTTAKSLCFADGNPLARVMLVGEAPGADEDRVGLPFVGRSGQLLDRMLGAIGLNRASDVYIANTVPWRPPGNRTPTPQEMAICLPFIQRQIELCNPDILVCLGGPATQSMLGLKEGILRTRGRWFDHEIGPGRTVKALATLHPAYLLRQPLQKRLAWRDFKALKAAIHQLSSS